MILAFTRATIYQKQQPKSFFKPRSFAACDLIDILRAAFIPVLPSESTGLFKEADLPLMKPCNLMLESPDAMKPYAKGFFSTFLCPLIPLRLD
jgi:hypothetical protein